MSIIVDTTAHLQCDNCREAMMHRAGEALTVIVQRENPRVASKYLETVADARGWHFRRSPGPEGAYKHYCPKCAASLFAPAEVPAAGVASTEPDEPPPGFGGGQ